MIPADNHTAQRHKYRESVSVCRPENKRKAVAKPLISACVGRSSRYVS